MRNFCSAWSWDNLNFSKTFPHLSFSSYSFFSPSPLYLSLLSLSLFSLPLLALSPWDKTRENIFSWKNKTRIIIEHESLYLSMIIVSSWCLSSKPPSCAMNFWKIKTNLTELNTLVGSKLSFSQFSELITFLKFAEGKIFRRPYIPAKATPPCFPKDLFCWKIS